MPKQIPLLLLMVVPLVALVFTALWFFVLTMVSRVGGWRQLARVYPGPEPGPPPQLRWQAAQFGGVNYNGCVHLAATDAQLVLSMPRILHIAHPPIAVPWSDLRVTMRKHWYGNVASFAFAKAPEVSLHLRAELAEKVAEASGGRLRLPMTV